MSTLLSQARTRVPRIAEAAVERARLTVVPRTARRRAPRVPFVTLVSLLLVGGVAGLLFFNTSMQQASFTATDMEDEVALLHAHEQSLKMQLESLRDPQRVAVQARAMGMVPPSTPAFLRLSDGAVLGKPTPATVDDAIRVTPRPTRKPRDLMPPPVVVEPPEKSDAASDGAADTARAISPGTKKPTVRDRQQGSQR
jgi:hypothetical protein